MKTKIQMLFGRLDQMNKKAIVINEIIMVDHGKVGFIHKGVKI